MSQDVKHFSEQYFKEFSSYTPDQAFALTARSLGSASPIVKDSVIRILKEKGYNAMVDEGGVGGVSSPREGVEPLIIFDGGSSLKKINQVEVREENMKTADARYNKWKRVANQNKNKPW